MFPAGHTLVPRRLLAATAVACALLLPTRTVAGLHVCNNDAQPPCNCSQELQCTGTNDHSAPRKNILLLVSDDNTFCNVGFMQGMCLQSTLTPCGSVDLNPDPPAGMHVRYTNGTCATQGEVCEQNVCIRPCRTNLACSATNDRCTSSEEVALVRQKSLASLPLRLAVPECRSRSAKNEGRNKLTNIRGIFQFGLQYPRTLSTAEDATHDVKENDAHVYTPYLDTLAAESAVFPRGHAGGMECKAARTVFWNGMFNKHLIQSGFNKPNPDGADIHSSCDPSDTRRFSGVGCYLHNLSKRCYGGTGTCANTPHGPGCTCSQNSDCQSGLCTRGSYCVGGDADGASCTTSQECPQGNCSQYFVYLWGKEDISSTNHGDVDGGTSSGDPALGNIQSEVCDPYCDELAHGQIVIPGTMNQIDNIFRDIDNDVVQNDKTLRSPFMVWYAPKIPHLEKPVPSEFAGIYDEAPYWNDHGQDDVRAELARMSLFDAGVGELVDGLKRRCFCDSTGQAASLYDRTVILYVNDNGNRVLPFAKRQPTENGERSAIIVNEPGLRGSPPGALPDYVSGIDLLATMVSYAEETPTSGTPAANDCGPLSIPKPAGGTMQVEFGYPYLRNLCRVARSPKPPTRTEPFRKAYLAHHAPISLDTSHLKDRSLLTAPGKVGICGPNANTAHNHRRPCIDGADCINTQGVPNSDACHSDVGTCNCGSHDPCTRNSDCKSCGGDTCDPQSATNRGGRCINRPDLACSLDKECGVDANNNSLCPSGQCTNAVGGPYAEYNGKTCSSAADCVPPHTCQQITLKVHSHPDKGFATTLCDDIQEVRDINVDPDEGSSLTINPDPDVTPDYDYIAPTLRQKLRNCMRQFWDPCPRNTYDQPGSSTNVTCADRTLPDEDKVCRASTDGNTPSWNICAAVPCSGQDLDCPFAEPPFGTYGPE